MADAELLAMIDQVRRGLPVTDRAFDRIYPEEIRRRSAEFWTPVVVARRAAALLTATGATRILDAGAGVGKLCIIGALTTGATFTGVEHRAHLVEAGRAAIKALGIPRAHLMQGELDGVNFAAFDGFYFYNPFEENVFSPDRQLDQRVPLSEERRRADVALVEQALARAKAGSRVVTFVGFGGQMPASYRPLPEETRGTAFLRLWEQTEGRAPV